MQKISLTQPDDFHCHLREGETLRYTVPDIANSFARAIVMPNLKQPVTTVALAQQYYEQICQHIPTGNAFQPLMTLYLTNQTTVADIVAAQKSSIVHAVKLYPAGMTTGAQAGVSDFKALLPIFKAMSDVDFPLLIHGESRDPKVDVFDREVNFIQNELNWLIKQCPKLRIVLEHITTAEAANFVQQSSERIAATITPHHLLYDRNDLLGHGIKPHLFCLPILKRTQHKLALRRAATSGNPKFFLGTDSAPHAITAKEASCGCAGIYSAPYALLLYAQVFDEEQALDRLPAFASQFGANFYGLAQNTQQVTLQRQATLIPSVLAFGNEQVVPIAAGQTLPWTLIV